MLDKMFSIDMNKKFLNLYYSKIIYKTDKNMVGYRIGLNEYTTDDYVSISILLFNDVLLIKNVKNENENENEMKNEKEYEIIVYQDN